MAVAVCGVSHGSRLLRLHRRRPTSAPSNWRWGDLYVRRQPSKHKTEHFVLLMRCKVSLSEATLMEFADVSYA